MRGHFLVDASLSATITSKAFNLRMPEASMTAGMKPEEMPEVDHHECQQINLHENDDEVDQHKDEELTQDLVKAIHCFYNVLKG